MVLKLIKNTSNGREVIDTLVDNEDVSKFMRDFDIDVENNIIYCGYEGETFSDEITDNIVYDINNILVQAYGEINTPEGRKPVYELI